MEVPVENIASAKNAYEGGAIRLELCSALSEGGLTPSLGMLKVIKSIVNIPVHVMLRPRPGNFTYTPGEMSIIKQDARVFVDNGADGFVFGALTKEGNVDVAACREVLDIVGERCVTFHRAFDWTWNPYTALDDIIELGFKRILTSGQQDTAFNGISLISELVERAQNRIIIMPGCGINSENIKVIAVQTKVSEFHASARKSNASVIFKNAKCSMGTQDQYEKITCAEEVSDTIKNFHIARRNIF